MREGRVYWLRNVRGFELVAYPDWDDVDDGAYEAAKGIPQSVLREGIADVDYRPIDEPLDDSDPFDDD